jgi:hypothetical protein
MVKLLDLMMGGFLVTKYFDLDSPVVNVQVNNTLISNTLIDLGATINVMRCETMQALGIIGLRGTPTILIGKGPRDMLAREGKIDGSGIIRE